MLSEADLRYAAALVTLIPGIEIEFDGAAGTTRVVSADPGPDGVSAGDFRDAVVASLDAHDDRPLISVLGVADMTPVQAAVRTNGSISLVERGSRWRRSCACGSTDYVVTRLRPDEAFQLARAALRETIPDVDCRAWTHEDRGLGTTVLACELPSDIDEGARERTEQALRDFTVMCRVRASMTQA